MIFVRGFDVMMNFRLCIVLNASRVSGRELPPERTFEERRELRRQHIELLSKSNQQVMTKLTRLAQMSEDLILCEQTYHACQMAQGPALNHAPGMLNTLEQAEARFINYTRGVYADHGVSQFHADEIIRLEQRRLLPRVNEGIQVPDLEELRHRVQQSEREQRRRDEDDAAIRREEEAARRREEVRLREETSRQLRADAERVRDETELQRVRQAAARAERLRAQARAHHGSTSTVGASARSSVSPTGSSSPVAGPSGLQQRDGPQQHRRDGPLSSGDDSMGSD